MKRQKVSAGRVAARLRRAGLNRLARRVIALLPDEVSDAQDTELALREKMDDASPAYQDRLRNALDITLDTLRESGPRLKPVDRVANPNYVGRDSVREPNRIAR